MKKLLNVSTLLPMLLLCMPASGQSTVNIEGTWLGAVEINGMKMRLAFKVLRNAEGFTAKFDSVDQGVTDLIIDSVIQQGKSIRFSAPKLGLSYEGTLSDKGDDITGALKQGPASFPLMLRRIAEVPKLRRRQDPQKPYPYDEQEVSYK